MSRTQTLVLERLGVALNYADTNVETFPGWKLELVLTQISKLQALMETTDRRSIKNVQ